MRDSFVRKISGVIIDFFTMKNKNSIGTLMSQVIHFPGRFIKGRLDKPKMELSQLKNGSGSIVEYDGKSMAAYKDDAGKLYSFSPVCRHLGCIVGWNDEEKTWDCPCHGSRYRFDGKVVHGPAAKDLIKIEGKTLQ
jgi:Rieske Fe-S protein